MKRLITILVIALFICMPFKMEAVIAYPYPIEVKQPNGETITIRMHGDEYFHYITVEDGAVVVFDQQSGYYMYAVIDNGRLLPGSVKVSNSHLRSAASGFLKSDSKEFLEQVRQPALSRIFEEKLSLRSPQQQATVPVTGNRKGLVILANFKDRKFSGSDPRASFEKMLNQQEYSENGATGSARDFYMENSNGKFTPDFDVYGPVELPNDIAFYGANGSNDDDKNAEGMIVDACNAAKIEYSSSLNFADYDYDRDGYVDNVFVFYAGYNEAESGGKDPDLVWPHKSSVYYTNTKIDGVRLADYACTSELSGSPDRGGAMAGIGTFTHEYGHVLGLPDLYDADGADNGEGPGVGYWCTMSGGAYLNGGKTPPYFGAIERYILGWIEPEVIEPGDSPITKTLPPITDSGNNVVYRLNTPTPEEYFLFEVRKKQGWDAYLRGEGMLVFHVDRTRTNDENKTISVYGRTEKFNALRLWEYYLIPNIIGDHQCYDLLRANNNPNSEQGNPFPGTSNTTTLSDYTQPGLLAWNGRHSNALIDKITRDAATGNVSFVLSKNAVAAEEALTNPVTEILQTSVRLNGTILGERITEKGFCWNTTGTPTLNDRIVNVPGSTSGTYHATITGLSLNTKYYVRAYMKTSGNQIYYGETLSFNTLPQPTPIPFAETFMDGKQGFWTVIDGNNDGKTWQFYSQKQLQQTGYKYGAATVDIGDKEGDDWLITPQLAIPENVKNLKFSLEVIVFNDAVLTVGISDTYADPVSFELWRPSPLEDEYPDPNEGEIHSLSSGYLDEYVGKNIFIAFINQSVIESQMWFSKFAITADFPNGIDGIDDVRQVDLPIVYVQNKTVYFKNVYDNGEAEIFDAAGKLHCKISVSDGASRYLNEPGIYIVKLKNGKQTYNYKLIVR